MGDQTGTKVRAYDVGGDDLGEVHLPLPILVGDVVAFDQGPAHEIIAVLYADDGRPVGVRVRPIQFRRT